ncbi:MAG: DNA primase DnaG [Candidatus Micrarchaeia archaeon]
MGKTYIDTVKYVVFASVEIDGLVEKPDVVGAIFGQTEGLLGDELDLRDLQKNGRIGRIEVDLNPRGGKSVGKIKLPSSLDMVETCILASALETVDRVGPCEAKIGVEKVEDTRNAKRKVLIERAKNLLKNLLLNELPESREISEMVRQEVKVAEIAEYGADKLPCGPNIDKNDEIIIVEGRADVLNLLKNDITNVIAVGGANVGPTIAKLAKEKEVTVFLDGDRGGDIILTELANVADIDFVARAPHGKEVEELGRKEMIKCLRAKVPYEQANSHGDDRGERRGGDRYQRNSRYDDRRNNDYREERRGGFRDRDSRGGRYQQREERVPPVVVDHVNQLPQQQEEKQQTLVQEQPARQPREAPVVEQQAAPEPRQEAPAPRPAEPKPASGEVPEPLAKSLSELENTLHARFYDASLNLVKEVPIRDMYKTLEAETSVHAVVFDGIVTQRFADLAEKKGVKAILGAKMGNVFKRPEGVLISTKN